MVAVLIVLPPPRPSSKDLRDPRHELVQKRTTRGVVAEDGAPR